jgi:lysyl-tRNA synthetase class 2
MASIEELKEIRLQKLALLESAGMDPYPARVSRTHALADLRTNFETVETDGATASVAGRIMAIRGQGAILFVVLDDGTDRFQTVFKKDTIEEKLFTLFTDAVDIGDFISVSGTVFTTERGEKSVLAVSWSMVTKALLPLPEKWHGITDDDERYRKRYLDLLMNPELRDMFLRKAKFWETTRNFLKEKGFVEIETPTLEVTTGGAEANPFKTHHKDFDIDVYLRISVGELWQKRLMAGNFPKTFEIGRVYRNEGSSPEHLQEFTNMEFYEAYADYEDGMRLTEELYKRIAVEVYGKTEFTARGYTFNLAGEWPRIEYVEEVKRVTGIDVLSATESEMEAKLKELGVVYEGNNKERLTDTLWKYCRKQIAGPVFLVGHPKLVSPLSKARVDNPLLTERFQIIIAGSEAGNGFSELNDPVDQRARFELQQQLIERGDSEAMMPEWEFVEMLEHGMPPTCGFGFGERLFSFFEDKPIRETTLFPLMRPHAEAKKPELMSAVAVVNMGAGMERWQEMNTVAHLTTAFGARVGKKELFSRDEVLTKDNTAIKLNIRHGIVIKSANSKSELLTLSRKAKEMKLEVDEFTREMLETTNDKKIIEMTKEKNADDVEYLGVLVYGEKKEIEELTEEFQRYV